jgi:hypothetical protein
MAISCPNKNTQEWKDLVQEFGEVEAMLAYVKNNEVIPSVEEAKNILVESFPSYEEDPTLQYKKDLEFHINTIHVVSNFLEKIGVGTRFVQEFFSKGGSVIENALAAANFIEGTVDIIDDVEKRPSAWNKLPEEAAHWWYRLLNKNSALKDALLTSAKTTRKEEELRKSLYGNTYKGPKIIGKLALDEQGNITNLPVLSPIREEAIGQLIAEAIKRIETKEGSPSDYSFLDMFIKWINKMIDIFKSIKKDPFEIAAMKILSSDISDLLSFEEYKNIHNEVYFTDKLTNRSVDPIDISLMEEISNGIVLKDEDSGYYMLYNPTIDEALSPQFPSKEQLEIWLYDIYGKEYDKKQKEIIEEVEDNQDFVDYILNKKYARKIRYLNKTAKKFFEIRNTNRTLTPLPYFFSNTLTSENKEVIKKLNDSEKNLLKETNSYENIVPTLKSLPLILKKYKKIPISLNEQFKMQEVKKQELNIINNIISLIKKENPEKKTISSEDLVNEIYNFLKLNYLLGFANENDWLSYKIDQTFTYVPDRMSDEDIDINNITENDLNNMTPDERQRIANILGLTKKNPSVYHNKISLRFNDSYFNRPTHFNYSPSAWGNLTYFYSKNRNVKDAVLLHEIQNDNIEYIRNIKPEKNEDIEARYNRYIKDINEILEQNLDSLKNKGTKQIVKTLSSLSEIYKSNNVLIEVLSDYIINSNPFHPNSLNMLFRTLKERIDEQMSLYEHSDYRLDLVQAKVDLAYARKRMVHDIIKKGGIKEFLSKGDISDLEYAINEANELYNGNARITEKKEDLRDNPIIRNIEQKVDEKIKKIYGKDFYLHFKFEFPAIPLPKAQRRNRILRRQINGRSVRSGNSMNKINPNINSVFGFTQKKILENLSFNIDNVKKILNMAYSRNNEYTFNKKLSKLTLNQFASIFNNFKENVDLLNKSIDLVAKKELEQLGQTNYEDIDKYDSDELIENHIVRNSEEKPYFSFYLRDRNISLYGNSKQEVLNKVKLFKESSLENRNKIVKEELESIAESFKIKALLEKNKIGDDYNTLIDNNNRILEREMNYFTPLVHFLIQKHIKQAGKQIPMYFSGYNITKLTQGSTRTALIYAGKEEIDLELQQKIPEIKKTIALEYGIANKSDTDEVIFDKLNKWKKSNSNQYINRLLYYTGGNPFETGAIYNAMSQIPGIKLIWEPVISGIKNNTGGYLVDLTDYHFSGEEEYAPYLYGLETPKEKNNIITTPEGTFELNEDQMEQYQEMIQKYGAVRAKELITDFIDINDLRKYNVDPGFNKSKSLGNNPKKVKDAIQLYREGKITRKEYIEIMNRAFGRKPEAWERMLDKFEQICKFIPFPVTIIADETLPEAAHWDRKKKHILVNPLLLSEDIIGHEVGHILLQLLGGMTNPLVRRAREQLRGSDVEKEVQELYKDEPNYTEHPFLMDLEIVCTALGYESVDLFDDPIKQQQFDNWLVRFWHYIKQLLGIEKTAAKRLATMLFKDTKLEDKWIDFVKKYEENYNKTLDDKSKRKFDDKAHLERIKSFKSTQIDKLESYRNRAVELLERRLKIYHQTGRLIPVGENLEFLDKIRNAEDPGEALYNFVQSAKAGIDRIYTDYLSTQRPAELNKGKNEITARKLMQWKDMVNGYGLIGEMMTVLRPMFESIKNKSEDPSEYKNKKSIYSDKAFEQMQEIINRKNDITQIFLNEGLKNLKDFVRPHYGKIDIETKYSIEKDYLRAKANGTWSSTEGMYKMAGNSKELVSLEEYTHNYLKLNEDNIKKLTEESIETELLRAQGDVGQITRWLDTIIDSSDPIVSAMVSAFANADYNTVRETVKMRDELIDLIRELENYYNTRGFKLTDVKKMYDYMLEKDKHGNYTGNLLSELKSEYWLAYNKAAKEAKNRGFTQEQINKVKAKFTTLNSTFDWRRFNADEDLFIEEARKSGKYDITRYEIEKYENYRRSKGLRDEDRNPYEDISTIFKSIEFSELLNKWRRDNTKKYRQYDEKWINPDYKKLTEILKDKNDPRTKFYNYIIKMNETLGKEIPASQRIYNRLPRMLRDFTETIEQKGISGTIKGVKESLSKTFKSKKPEEATNISQFKEKVENINEEGDPILFMPVYFNGKVSDEETGIILPDQSLDLGMLYYNYFRMAIDYKNKAEILPEMELAKYFVNNRRYLKLDENGNVMKDALDPTRKREITTKGNNALLANQLNDWFEAVFYGMRYKDEGLIPGTKLEVAKTLDTINKYTALNLLGLNFVQGTANLLLGQAMQWIESIGGNLYTPKDYAYAEWYYTTRLPGVLKDVGSRKPSNIVDLLNEQFDTLNEYEDGKMKNNTIFKRLFNTNSLFFTSHAGEHMILSQFMLAMLYNKKALDSEGKVIDNILNLYSIKNGKLVFDENKNRVSNWTDKDQKEFMFKMKRFMADIHGDYYHNSIPAFQRLALGRMAGLFRKFVVPGFKRRWGNQHADNLRQTMLEGYYRTFGKFIYNFVKELVHLKGSLAMEEWKTLTSYEKANVRRTLAEATFLIAALVLGYALTKIKDDDDDEKDNWWLSFGAYQSYRFMNELSFFILPSSAMNILRSPAAAMAMAENLLRFFAQILDVIDGPFERYDRGNWKDHMKIEKYLTNFVPIYKQLYRLRDIEDSVTWWKN